MKFSQFYFPPQEYVTDSERLRMRLGSYIQELSFHSDVDNRNLGDKIKQSVGISIPQYLSRLNYYYYNFEQFIKEIGMIDLLDMLSVVYSSLKNLTERSRFIYFVNNCFTELGLAYVINENGEVRFRPDQEFERNRILTLKSLTGSEYVAVLEAFNAAYNEFQSDIKKSKSALRYIFEANEILFKKMTKPGYEFERLSAANIDKITAHILNDIIGPLDETSRKATEKLLESYKCWVNAMHNYRHGQDVDTYDNPPIDLTILALSNGASYLRWLASVAQVKTQKQ